KVIEGDSVPITDDTPANRKLFVEMFAVWAYEQLERERRNYDRHASKRIPSVSLRQVQQRTKAIADGVISLEQLSSEARKELTSLARLHAHIGEDAMAKFGTRPLSGEKRRFGRRFRQPKYKGKFSRRRNR
ncbi:MAG TPA: hypothetical protein VFS65_02600, partial [Candidatus Saccharimonadales bacterium]|nr:hypothetical protein [Candidatus Saccharimonadales bacterium]